MSTPTLPTLRTEADQLLRLTAMSPVSQILAVALGQANNGTQPDPDASTSTLLEGIRTWPNQAPSDVEAIITNQVMRLLQRNTTIEVQSPQVNQVVLPGVPYVFEVSVSGVTQGDYVLIAVNNNESILGGSWTVEAKSSFTAGQVAVTLTCTDGILATNFAGTRFNIRVLKH